MNALQKARAKRERKAARKVPTRYAQANTGDLPEDQHGRVADMLSAARELCESRQKRQFITATWTGYLDCFPSQIQIQDN